MTATKSCSIPGCINLTQNKRYCAIHDPIASSLSMVCENSSELLLKPLNTLNDDILKNPLTMASPFMQCVAGALRHLIASVIDDSRFVDHNSNVSSNNLLLSPTSTQTNTFTNFSANTASTSSSYINHSLYRDIMEFSQSLTSLTGTQNDVTIKKSSSNKTTMEQNLYKNQPIVDVIIVNSKREDQCPKDYTLLSKSFCGKNADLNTGAGGRDVYLAYRRATDPAERAEKAEKSNDKLSKYNLEPNPLTSFSLFYAKLSEEPNFGFEAVKTIDGQPANLNLGTNTDQTIYISSHRGGMSPNYELFNTYYNPDTIPDLSPSGLTKLIQRKEALGELDINKPRIKPLSGQRGMGAPIIEIGVGFVGARVAPKPDWHEVRFTSFGHKASLNNGNDNATQSLLYYRVDIQPIIEKVYKPLLDTIPETFTPSQFTCTRAYIRTCTILTACLYSTSESIVLCALQAFSRICRDEQTASLRIDRLDPFKRVLPAALNAFIQCVCDAVPVLLSYFTTQSFDAVMTWFRSTVLLHINTLSIHTILRVLDICFLLRHEDKTKGVCRDILRVLSKRASDVVYSQSLTSVFTLDQGANSMIKSTTNNPQLAIDNSITTTRRTSMEMGIFSSGAVRVNSAGSPVVEELPMSMTTPSNYNGQDESLSTQSLTLSTPRSPSPTSSNKRHTGPAGTLSPIGVNIKSPLGVSSPAPPMSPSSVSHKTPMPPTGPVPPSTPKSASSPTSSSVSTSSNSRLTSNTINPQSIAPITGTLSNIATNFLSNPFDMCASIVRHIADTVVESSEMGGDVGRLLTSKLDTQLRDEIPILAQSCIANFCPRNWVLSPPTGYTVNPILTKSPIYLNGNNSVVGVTNTPKSFVTIHNVSVSTTSDIVIPDTTNSPSSTSSPRTAHDDGIIIPTVDESNTTSTCAASTATTKSSFLSLKNTLTLRKNKVSTSSSSSNNNGNTNSTGSNNMNLPRLSTNSILSSTAASPSVQSRGTIDTSVYTTWTPVFHPSPDVCNDGETPYEWKYIKFIDPSIRTESLREHNARRKAQRILIKNTEKEVRARLNHTNTIQEAIRSRISEVYSHSYSDLHLHVRNTLLMQKDSLAQLSSCEPHQSYDEMMLVSVLLFICKMINLPPSHNFSKMEHYKRKVHALNQLSVILVSSTNFFTLSPIYMSIIQRYVFPAILSCVEIQSISVFRAVLDVFTILWQDYYSMLIPELGIMLDSVYLRMLTSPKVAIQFKRDILSTLHRLINTPFALINLFYCYDCSFGSFNPTLRPPTINAIENNETKYYTSFGGLTDENSRIYLFERLITVISTISEGDPRIFQNPATNSANASTHNNSNSNTNVNVNITSNTNVNTTSGANNVSISNQIALEIVMIDNLRKYALVILEEFVRMMAEWSGVPFMTRTTDVRSSLRRTCLTYADYISDSPETNILVPKEDWKLMLSNVERLISYGPSPSTPPIQKSGVLEEFLRVEIQNFIGTMPVNEYRGLLAESRQVYQKEVDAVDRALLNPTTAPYSLSYPEDGVFMKIKSSTNIDLDMLKLYEHNKRAALERSESRLQTVKISHDRSLYHAIRSLRTISPKLVTPEAVASFLYYTEGLSAAQVGDMLANSEDADLFLSYDYEQLRYYYVRLLDFTGLSFTDALRYYTTHCCFKLPGEAQKIDRMVEIFCEAYCRDNPTVFSAPGVAHTVCFMLMILNTDLHNPKLNEEGGGGQAYKQMTLAQFSNPLRDCDGGNPLDPVFLQELYNSIASSAIVWISEENDENVSVDYDDEAGAGAFVNVHIQNMQHDDPSVFVRRACALMRFAAPTSIVSNLSRDVANMKFTTSTQFIKPMWELVWHRIYKAFSTRADSITTIQGSNGTTTGGSSNSNSNSSHGGNNNNSQNSHTNALIEASILSNTQNDLAYEAEVDIDSLNLCVDGASYGAVISILLGHGHQRDFFTKILAKLRYMEQRREELSAKRVIVTSGSNSSLSVEANKLSRAEINREIIQMLAVNEHLKQPWLQELRSLAESNVILACKSVLSNSLKTKHNITTQRKLQVLRKLQTDFGSGTEVSILPLGSTAVFYVEGDNNSRLSMLGQSQKDGQNGLLLPGIGLGNSTSMDSSNRLSSNGTSGNGNGNGSGNNSNNIRHTGYPMHSRNETLTSIDVIPNELDLQLADHLGVERMVVPDRTLVKEGKLVKVSSSGKRQEYTFFLFSDIMLYATEGTQPKYRAHRVLHLSLMRIDPMRGSGGANNSNSNTNNSKNNSSSSSSSTQSTTQNVEGCAFKIISPQKSFIVVAPNETVKNSWIKILCTAIQRNYQLRSKWLDLHVYSKQFSSEILLHEGSNNILTSTTLTSNSMNQSTTHLSSQIQSVSRSQIDDVELGRSSSRNVNEEISHTSQSRMQSQSQISQSNQSISSNGNNSPPYSGTNSMPQSPNIQSMDIDDGRMSFINASGNQNSLGLSQQMNATNNSTRQSHTLTIPPPYHGTSRLQKNNYSMDIVPESPGRISSVASDSLSSLTTASQFVASAPASPIATSVSTTSSPSVLSMPPPVPAHIRMRSIPTANKVTLLPEDILTKSSSFITHSSYYVNVNTTNTKTTSTSTVLNTAANLNMYCRLCIRPYAMFRRKGTCPNCQACACAECISKKSTITVVDEKRGTKKDSVQKVCDACYGFITGIIGPKLSPLIGNGEEVHVQL